MSYPDTDPASLPPMPMDDGLPDEATPVDAEDSADALPIGEAAPVYARQAPGDRGEMGQGVRGEGEAQGYQVPQTLEEGEELIFRVAAACRDCPVRMACVTDRCNYWRWEHATYEKFPELMSA